MSEMYYNPLSVIVKGIVGAVCGIISYVLGGINHLTIILVILMIIDYVSGVAAAIVAERKFSTKIAMKGLLKKVMFLFFVLFGYMLDMVVMTIAVYGFLNVENFRAFGIIVSCYLIGTEGLSIMKNFSDCGLPTPAPFLKLFQFLQGLGEKEK